MSSVRKHLSQTCLKRESFSATLPARPPARPLAHPPSRPQPATWNSTAIPTSSPPRPRKVEYKKVSCVAVKGKPP
ncbi:hypothetical protein E2C01_051805 [Portunus trituberculatus]|uniref:Uncharacterized protein n=1 Tax=Portunus trituberculatus TaxID=210409 RepID=A0A5B7GKN9_PORTR|nr:hypothetical protein [Portunus trituberculatus]